MDKGGYHVEELVEVQRTPMGADLFAVPAGFAKTTPEELRAAVEHGKPGAKSPAGEE